MQKKLLKTSLKVFTLQVWAKFLTIKSEFNNVVNALGSNQSLQTLDITGNLRGDVSASNIQSFQALVQTQSIYNIIDFRLEFAI